MLAVKWHGSPESRGAASETLGKRIGAVDIGFGTRYLGYRGPRLRI
jgi:hypothetical protein